MKKNGGESMEKKKKKYVPPKVEFIPISKEEMMKILSCHHEKERSSDEKNDTESKKSKD